MAGSIYLDTLLSFLILRKDVTKTEILEKFQFSDSTLKSYLKEASMIYHGILLVKSDKNIISIEVTNDQYLFNILRMSSNLDFNQIGNRVAYLLFRLISSNDYING